MKHPFFSAKTIAVLALALGGLSLAAPQALARSATDPAAKKNVKTLTQEADDIAYDANEPDVQHAFVATYRCELGNNLTVYKNDGDEAHIALRWKKHLHRLNRVSTTTGADRYENVNNGLVWIVIPSKGLLLDGKRARQLANECTIIPPAAAAGATATNG